MKAAQVKAIRLANADLEQVRQNGARGNPVEDVHPAVSTRHHTLLIGKTER